MYRPYLDNKEGNTRIQEMLQRSQSMFSQEDEWRAELERDDGESQIDSLDYSNEIVADNSRSEQKKTVANKRRGRPSKSQEETAKEWDDNETFLLIDLWRNCEQLYNPKLPSYKNRDIRSRNIEKIRMSLEENDVIASAKQIVDKFTNLRSYYGAQRRLEQNSSKKSGSGEKEKFVSSWKFFKHLEFLSDSYTPSSTYGNLGSSDDAIIPGAEALPSRKNGKRKESSESANASSILQAAANSLEQIASCRSKRSNNASEDSDKCFGNLIANELGKIEEGPIKAMLKIDIQKLIVQAQYYGPNVQSPLAQSPISSQVMHSPPFQHPNQTYLTQPMQYNFTNEHLPGPSRQLSPGVCSPNSTMQQ